MTRSRMIAAAAGVVLWLAAVVAWALTGVVGLLLVLVALVIALLALIGAVLVRTDRATKSIASTAQQAASIRTLVAEAATRQEATLEAVTTRDAMQPALDGMYAQIEALLSLHSTLRPRRPLPPLRGWAVAADFMARAVSIVLDQRPATIVECGSGASTVFLGLALQRAGTGRVVALEHQEQYAQATQGLLAEHGLLGVATVRYAPLRPVAIQGARWLWYDLGALEGVDACELLIVDGPPRSTQEMARYPALPLLRDRLAPGASILLDDYRRGSERRTVRRWMDECPQLELQVHDHKKQTAELRLPGSVVDG